MASSVKYELGSRLERSVPRNSSGLCGTATRRLRRVLRLRFRISTSSMVKIPEVISIRWKIVAIQ
jgi:hypothetical protein